MSNVGQLIDRPKAALATLAKRRGIRGWESMNKGDLVKALARGAAPVRATPAKAPKSARPARVTVKAAAKVTAKRPAKLAAKPAAKITHPAKPGATMKPMVNGLHRATTISNGTLKTPAKPTTAKPIATKPGATKPVPTTPIKELPARPSGTPTKDRIILAVNDPYWLHVMWDLSAHSVQRAEAALKQDWYGARLIIRLSDVTSHDTTSTSETPIRDIPITGDGRNWYINVPQPPRQYRVDIGYISRRGDFFVLARSNVVTPPKAGSSEALDAGWEKDPKKAERIMAMSTGFESASHPELKAVYEERLRRPLGAPKETAFGTGATPPGSVKKFFFDIDARLIVFGRTDPTAHLTLGNDPIDLNPNGTFLMEFSLPDSRQIIPAVATSADGVEERTIVLAVERNTKYLDPMIHDQMNEGRSPKYLPMLDLLFPLVDEPDAPPDEFSLVRFSRRAMATTFEIAIPAGTHSQGIAAANAALDLIDELEDQMTVYRDHSEIVQLNETAADSPVVVERELFDLFTRCAAWTIQTEGAFDIAMGALVKAWGFFHRAGRVPTPTERNEAMARTGFRHVILNPESRAVKYRRAGLELNLGAVGKGYALDRAARLLFEEWRVRSALLHGGGSSVYAIGAPPGEPRGWPVRLKHPTEPTQSLGTVYLRDRGLGTSAATFQFFEYKGQKLGHLLDPRTGWPAHGIASASVIASTAAEADAMSTAAFVLGAAGAERLTRLNPALGAVVLPDDRTNPAPEVFNLAPSSFAP